MMKYFLLLLTIIFFSGNIYAQKKVNTRFNKRYLESRKTFTGRLEPAVLDEFRRALEQELKTSLPADQAVLINYKQYGANCTKELMQKKSAPILIQNENSIAHSISQKYPLIPFWVYHQNTVKKELFERNKLYRPDSGFLKDHVFDLSENCSAFFLLKPDGTFMKHYGFDYFSMVDQFMKED